MKTIIAILVSIIVTSFFGVKLTTDKSHLSIEIAHSGGTDKCGCHYNRKTGEYHCHKRKKRGGDCPA